MSDGHPEYLTLCMICRRALACTLPRLAQQPVWRCDEFQPASPSVTANGVGHGEDRSGGDEYRDLCSSCRGRASCVFPRPSGGVWHCEGYH